MQIELRNDSRQLLLFRHGIGIAILLLVGVIASFAAGTVLLTYENEWSSHRKHAQEIDRSFHETLLPAATFIRSFVEKEHRLPSDEEMAAAGWHTGNATDGKDLTFYREPLNQADPWGVLGKDFLLETEVPGWNIYYRSVDQKRIEANWE